MKTTLTLIILLAFIVLAGRGQTKGHRLKVEHPITHYYWQVNGNYTTDCKSGSMFITLDVTEPITPDFDYCYHRCEKWCAPNKLLKFEITHIIRLAEPDTSKGNDFECEKPYITPNIIFDTVRTTAATFIDTGRLYTFTENNGLYLADFNAVDTIKCYFKEAAIKHNKVKEVWQTGFVVLRRNGWVAFGKRNNYESILYADKRRVTNHIIDYFIETK